MRICLFLSFSFCGEQASDFCFDDIQHFRCYAANVNDRDLYSHKAKQASDQMYQSSSINAHIPLNISSSNHILLHS